jgi:O-antigen/teichoic acid export membrane protein
VFLFANSAFYAMLNATDRQGRNAWATGVAAVINIGLNLALIPSFGYLGASTVTVITEAILCSLGWWFVQQRRPELRLPWIRLSWRPVLAGLVMGSVLLLIADLPLFVSAPVGSAVYIATVWLVRGLDPAEVAMVRAGIRLRVQRSPSGQ